MRILFKFASRSRPEKFRSCLLNIFNGCEGNEYRILASLDEDDPYRKEYQSVLDDFWDSGLSKGRLISYWGYSKSKVYAINRDIKSCDYNFDILCAHSDDMLFIKHGFDVDIRDAFADFSGLVHFPDQHANQQLCTYPMLSRDYYERFSFVYNPIYTSLYCDNEQQEVAKKLGCYKFVNKNILEHKHPLWERKPYDDLMKHNESFYGADGLIFKQRQAAGFP